MYFLLFNPFKKMSLNIRDVTRVGDRGEGAPSLGIPGEGGLLPLASPSLWL